MLTFSQFQEQSNSPYELQGLAGKDKKTKQIFSKHVGFNKGSTYKDQFAKLLNDIYAGAEVKRTQFKTRGRSPEWGYDVIDDLVDSGIIIRKKKGRTEYVELAGGSSAEPIQASKINENSIRDEVTKIITASDKDLDFSDVFVSFDKKKQEVNVTVQKASFTQYHDEKGSYTPVPSWEQQSTYMKKMATKHLVGLITEAIKSGIGGAAVHNVHNKYSEGAEQNFKEHKGVMSKMEMLFKY